MTDRTTDQSPASALSDNRRQQADERHLHALLRPMGEAWCDLDEAIEEYVRGLSDDVLADHFRACEHMTPTNCWWANYRVAPLVADAVKREQFIRNRRKFHGVTP